MKAKKSKRKRLWLLAGLLILLLFSCQKTEDAVPVFGEKNDDPGETFLARVSDRADAQTRDDLIREGDPETLVWESSDPLLYRIENGAGTVDPTCQTHREQKVRVSVHFSYNGKACYREKEILVAPIALPTLPETPVAAYVQASSCAWYLRVGEHETLFEESAEQALDIVYYAFARLENGVPAIPKPEYIDACLRLRRAGVRVILSFRPDGVEENRVLSETLDSEESTARLCAQIADLAETYGFDGIDLDWEALNADLHPTPEKMTRLAKGLRREFSERADPNAPFFLSAAVPASSWGLARDRFDFPALSGVLDYLNLMSYDCNRNTVASHLAPLYSSEQDSGYGFGAVWAVERLAELGFDPGKILIGCTAYGKAYACKDPALGAEGSLTALGSDGAFESGTVFAGAIEPIVKGGAWEEKAEYSAGGFVGTYYINREQSLFLTADTALAYREKYRYASKTPGQGVMLWAYGQDANNTFINTIANEKTD